ncbi:MAG: hypothetical protein IKN17_12335 [Ruminococcus sp.]|nr:hypothetical protein [Ruminococcus sp.]
MAVFRKNTTKPEVDADLIRDYTDIKPERMHLHRITPAEYDAVPRKLKSRKALLFCPAGAMLLLTGAFAVGSDISAVKDFINDEPKSGVMLFAALMVSTTLFLAVSLIWAALTVGAVIMVVYLIKGFRDHNAYVFAPLIAGCLCELPLTLWVTSYVFKPPVAPGQVCFTDCIIVRTGSLLGKQTASLIVPESRLYVDDMTVKSEIVRNIPQNVPVRVYYHPFSQEILWVREL